MPYHHILSVCLVIAGFGMIPMSAVAQDMRVYTTVSEVTKGLSSPKVLSHSLTLFHAGKVYDYMEEAGEVVIYEPVHHRFVILGKNFVAAEVPFTEVNHSLESTRTETTRMLDQLRQQADDKSMRVASLIQFQLEPAFKTSWDESHQRLTMAADPLQYSVRTAKIESPQFVRQYLDYADWTARLNFVLRPNAAFPAARLQLNESLRQEELLPTQVDLQLRQVQRAEPMRLRAEHQFSWEFQSVDRRHINHWERQLRSNEVRWITFYEYQQQLVAERTR